MISLPVRLPGLMFLSRGRGSLSMSGGVSVWGISIQGHLCLRGLCPEGSLSGRPPYGKERAVHILLKCFLVLRI